MSLRSRLRALEEEMPEPPASGCERCDDPALEWQSMLLVPSKEYIGQCPECGRDTDLNGTPIGIRGSHSVLAVIVLELPVEEVERGAALWQLPPLVHPPGDPRFAPRLSMRPQT